MEHIKCCEYAAFDCYVFEHKYYVFEHMKSWNTMHSTTKIAANE